MFCSIVIPTKTPGISCWLSNRVNNTLTPTTLSTPIRPVDLIWTGQEMTQHWLSWVACLIALACWHSVSRHTDTGGLQSLVRLAPPRSVSPVFQAFGMRLTGGIQTVPPNKLYLLLKCALVHCSPHRNHWIGVDMVETPCSLYFSKRKYNATREKGSHAGEFVLNADGRLDWRTCKVLI